MNRFFYAFGFSLIIFGACSSKNNSNTATQTSPELPVPPVDTLYKHYDENDSNVLKAYVNDKSTISVKDIDLNDTTFSARSKFLYTNKVDTVAVVYGFKNDMSKPGIAIVQKNIEKPMKMKQEIINDPAKTIYSDGNLTLTRAGDFIFLGDNMHSTQYVEIK